MTSLSKESAGAAPLKPEMAALFAHPVSALSRSQAEFEHKLLVEEIKRHDRLYYQESAPEISDADYDRLRARAEAIEHRFPELVTPESPTVTVGAPPAP